MYAIGFIIIKGIHFGTCDISIHIHFVDIQFQMAPNIDDPTLNNPFKYMYTDGSQEIQGMPILLRHLSSNYRSVDVVNMFIFGS